MIMQILLMDEYQKNKNGAKWGIINNVTLKTNIRILNLKIYSFFLLLQA